MKGCASGTAEILYSKCVTRGPVEAPHTTDQFSSLLSSKHAGLATLLHTLPAVSTFICEDRTLGHLSTNGSGVKIPWNLHMCDLNPPSRP